MAKTTDISSLKHVLAQQLHLYYEPQDDGTNVLRHIRVHQRTFNVPSEGITIDTLPDDFIGSEHIKDGTVQEQDLSQQLKGSLLKTSEKGVNGGIATLGSDGKVPAAQLPQPTVATEEDVRGIVSNYTE
jgi:hypothetical protein